MKALLAESLPKSRLLQAVVDSLQSAGPDEPCELFSLEQRFAAAIAGAGLLRTVVRSLVGSLLAVSRYRPPFTHSLLLIVLQPGHQPGLRSCGAGGGGPGF